MESPPTEEAHRLAPENLPPPIVAAMVPVYDPKAFDKPRKIAIVADLIRSKLPTGEFSQLISAREGFLITPAQLRGWMHAYTVQATKQLKSENDLFRKLNMETATPAAAEPAPQRSPVQTKNGTRRLYTNNEKILYAVRYKKMGPGVSIAQAALQLGVGASPLRRWVADFEKMKPSQRGVAAHAAKNPEGLFTNDKVPNAEKMKALDAVKAGERATIVAKRMNVTDGTIRNWWARLRKDTWPAQPTTHNRGPHPRQAEALALLAAGEHVTVIAKKLGASEDSVKNWWKKANPRKNWVKTFNHFKGIKGIPKPRLPPDTVNDERAPKALARVAGGELISDVAEELGVTPGTVRGWWRALKGNNHWPKQYGIKNNRTKAQKKARNPYGPNKKTRDRLSIREAVLSNSMVLTAQQQKMTEATQDLNGHPQPISTGKTIHDAIVFLQIARDEYTKAIKAGSMRADDPTMLFPMLALHTLNK